MKNKKLTKEAKDFILSQMAGSDRLDLKTVMDYVRPHYLFDEDAAKEQGVRAVSRSLIKQIRDEEGLPEFYQFKDDEGKSIYLNISKTVDETAYNRAEERIIRQADTLNAAKKKFELNQQRMDGQLTLFDETDGEI